MRLDPERFGVTTPIMLAKAAGKESYTVIAGHRRYLAAKAVGLSEVPAQITSSREVAGDGEHRRALIENVVREDMTPVDEAKAFLALQESEHLTEKGIAELLSIPERRVEERLDYWISPRQSQAKVDAKEIRPRKRSDTEADRAVTESGSGARFAGSRREPVKGRPGLRPRPPR